MDFEKYTHCVTYTPSFSTFLWGQAHLIPPPKALFLPFFLGPHWLHMEVSKLGVQSELQLPAYTTTSATWDPSLVCNLHHSLWQHGILNPLSKSKDPTHILMDGY